jgi:cysteine desulfurase
VIWSGPDAAPDPATGTGRPDHEPAIGAVAGAGNAGDAGDADAADLVLDVRGRRCPLPVIELARHIADVPVGGVVAVLSDDPAARLDIPEWCRMRNQEYLGAAPSGTTPLTDTTAGQTPPTTAYCVRRRP